MDDVYIDWIFHDACQHGWHLSIHHAWSLVPPSHFKCHTWGAIYHKIHNHFYIPDWIYDNHVRHFGYRKDDLAWVIYQQLMS